MNFGLGIFDAVIMTNYNIKKKLSKNCFVQQNQLLLIMNSNKKRIEDGGI